MRQINNTILNVCKSNFFELFIHTYTYTHIYTPTHIRTHIRTYTHTQYIYIYIYVCVGGCVCVYIKENPYVKKEGIFYSFKLTWVSVSTFISQLQESVCLVSNFFYGHDSTVSDNVLHNIQCTFLHKFFT